MAANGNEPGAKPTLTNRLTNTGKWLIGYNNTEANRLGVPIVSSKEWIAEKVADPKGQAVDYVGSLFPFVNWIGSYNLQWAIGDLIAGITVGLVVVPQSMSYAIIAGLAPEFGLYSSFVGVLIYALFATSKDVTIGPVAVMSLQTGNVIKHVMAAHPGVWSANVIASCLAFICGIITLGIGILRIGWIVELIPTPAVAGFMTGSAISIAAGQLPKLFGVKVDTTQPAYLIIIHFLQQLPNTTIDAAFGITALFFLYATRSFFNWLPRRYPRTARFAFFASVLRNAFVIIILTIASRVWLGHKYPVSKSKGKYPISILKTVPSGFKHIGEPNLDPKLWSALGSQLPVSTIILLLEHIAIAKSFGRLNDYKINNNQELIAIGVTNLIGPAFGAYAATGSFSRTAIKSKSGVRTPLAGWVTAVIVIIALFALTGTFYWIPSAALSAVIIHAVGDLIAPPSLLYKFWLVSPFELLIFLGSVFATVFKNAEWGVYVSVIASLILLLIRIARPNGTWLGRVRVHHSDTTDVKTGEATGANILQRDVFVPLDDKDGLRDPSIYVEAPPPGVLIFRFQESFTYPNASLIADLITDKVKAETRPGQSDRYARPGDRPWNDPGPLNPVASKVVGFVRRRAHRQEEEFEEKRPVLRALVFDLSSVSNVDTTSIQLLVDVRTVVERYANQNVEFHFANILSPWIRRGLLAGGFGTGIPLRQVTEVAPVVAYRDGVSFAAQQQQREAEARRRANAINAGVSLGDRTDVGEFEAGVGSRADAPEPKDNIDVDGSGARYAHYGTSKTAVPPQYEVPSLEKGAQSPSSDSDADSSKGLPLDPTRNASDVSVPIVWGQELTPFFHLDLHAAVAATEHRS